MNVRSSKGHAPNGCLRSMIAAVFGGLLIGQPSIGPAHAEAASSEASAAYRFQRLDVPGAERTLAASINAHGEVTGSYNLPEGLSRGFLYAGGKYTNLDVPGAMTTTPSSVNANGQVAGIFTNDSEAIARGFIYSAGTYVTLPDCGGATFLNSMNDRGQVTGNCSPPRGPGVIRAFVYSGGSYTFLDIPGATFTWASSINARGQVTGIYGDAKGGHGFIYSGGTFTTLDVPGATDTQPLRINASGQVAGIYMDQQGQHGFLYSGGTYTVLDAPGTTAGTHAVGINDVGQVIGKYPAFVYRGGTYTTLQDPEGNVISPSSINAGGQITGVYGDGQTEHGFIATPVVAVLDDFNRENGRLGPNWKGRTAAADYQILNQKAQVLEGGPIYWQLNPFGLDQEAFITLTRIDPAGAEQGLLLKVQGGTGNYRKGALAVKYDAGQHVVRVATWRPRSASWRDYRVLPVPFADGDKLGARVLASGKVRIFRNEQRVGTIMLNRVDRQFFDSRIGRIGLWFENAPNAVVDDFGGGTRVQ